MRTLALILLLLSAMNISTQAAPNPGHLANGSFELEAGGHPIGWQRLWGQDGSVAWVDDVAHVGDHAVRLTGSACLVSDPLPNNGDLITVSGWLKTDRMTLGKKPWLKASIVVLELDARMQPKGHRDVARIHGTNGWKEYSRTFSLPESIPYYRVALEYGEGCTGTMWGDDLTVTTAGDPYTAPPHETDLKQATVTVEATRTIGPLPDLWRSIDQSYLTDITVPRRAETIPALRQAGFRYVRLHECIVGPKIYREVDGKPVYNWTLFDQGIRTLLVNDLKPMLVLESTPTPIAGKQGQSFRNIHPPLDYGKWQELIYQLVRHCVDTYGEEEVAQWYFEVWNEPDATAYFLGNLDQFFKLYDHTVNGAVRAFPGIRIGGPGGAGNGWVLPLVEHCARGRNAATGMIGTRLDFISWHIYCSGTGIPDERVIRRSLLQVNDWLKNFPRFARLPRFITEFSCNSSPTSWLDDAYRGPFTLRALLLMDELGIEQAYSFCVGDYLWDKQKMIFRDTLGMFTNPGFPKAPFHLYTLLNQLPGQRVQAMSSNAPIDVIAGYDSDTSSLGVLLGNWVDDPAATFETTITLRLNCPSLAGKKLNAHLVRVNPQHSNAYDDWQALGSPQVSRDELHAYRAGQRDTLRQQEVAKLIDSLTQAARLEAGTHLPLTFDETGNTQTTLSLPAFGLAFLSLSAAE